MKEDFGSLGSMVFFGGIPIDSSLESQLIVVAKYGTIQPTSYSFVIAAHIFFMASTAVSTGKNSPFRFEFLTLVR